MNERIRQLAEQAKIDYDLRPEIARAPVWIGTDEELAKFAELIVRECIDTVQRRWVGDHNREDQEVLRCVADIKQHFGIEL